MGTWYPPKKLAESHPVLGCRHVEGGVVGDDGLVRRWLPGVHDCAYVDARNAALAAGQPLATVRVRPLGR